MLLFKSKGRPDHGHASATLPAAKRLPRTWLVAASRCGACAIAGGYALALHEIEALYIGVSVSACIAVLIDFRIGAVLLIVLLPMSATALFPRAMLGITGLNPINLLLAGDARRLPASRGGSSARGRCVPQAAALAVCGAHRACRLDRHAGTSMTSPGLLRGHGASNSSPRGPATCATRLVKPLFTVLAARCWWPSRSRRQEARAFIVADRSCAPACSPS